MVFNRLIEDFKGKGLLYGEPQLEFGLAAGNFYSKDEEAVSQYFNKKNWRLITPRFIAESIKSLADKPYENDPYVIASKLIHRLE